MEQDNRYITFSLGGMLFEYDGIELYDEENSIMEDRYNMIGDVSAGNLAVSSTHSDIIIGNVRQDFETAEILFVVYTERVNKKKNGKEIEITRLISARYATSFERGMYYGKFE